MAEVKFEGAIAGIRYAIDLPDDWAVLVRPGGMLQAFGAPVFEYPQDGIVSVRGDSAGLQLTMSDAKAESLDAFAASEMRRFVRQGEPFERVETTVSGARAIAYSWTNGVEHIGSWYIGVGGRIALFEGHASTNQPKLGIEFFAEKVAALRWLD